MSFRGPIGRVAVAGATIVILMIVAVGVSVWRSETSATLAGVALGDEKQLATAVSGHDLIFDRANVFDVNRPLTDAKRADLTGAQRNFETTFGVDLKASAQLDPGERRILVRVLAANRQLMTLERTIQPLLGRRAGAVALEGLRVQRQVVDSAIDSYVRRNGNDATTSQKESQAAHRDARAIAIVVAALAVLLAISLVAYMINLLKTSFRRIRADSYQLELARLETLERLALAAEYRDDNTLHHTERVGHLSALVADRMGLAPETVALIRQAAPLHDVGKLGVSDSILLKPGRLTGPEWELMKRHSAIGAAILAGSRSPVLQLGERIAHWHHEHWDGSGYPDGLVGYAIPISARIVAITDVFDALTHERPYKQAWPVNDALAEIEHLAGLQFDPDRDRVPLLGPPTPQHTSHRTEPAEPCFTSSLTPSQQRIGERDVVRHRPIPASSGNIIRQRLQRGGDRVLNRRLHIAPSRARFSPGRALGRRARGHSQTQIRTKVEVGPRPSAERLSAAWSEPITVPSLLVSVALVLGSLTASARSEESGQTMAEYGLLIAVIALIVVVVAVTLGSTISSLFGTTASTV